MGPRCFHSGTYAEAKIHLCFSDFKDADDNGWILINESNMPRITHNKQVDLDKPTYLQLKNVICNAATYEGTIKLVR